MKLRALSVAMCCALASVIVPAGGTGVVPGDGAGSLVAVANAQSFGGLADAALSPGQALKYTISDTVTDLRVTAGNQYAKFVQEDANDGKRTWLLRFAESIQPGTYTLGYSWTEAGETNSGSMRVTVTNYSLSYKLEEPLILLPGEGVTVTPTGHAPAGTKIQIHSTPLKVTSTKKPGGVHIQVPAEAHPGEYTVGLTLTYPNHTTQEAEIHLTVAPRKITFPASVNLARSQTVWVNASGDVPPWPEGGSIRAVPSSSARGLISTEVDGPKVTVKADPQAPLGEHTVTLIVNLPGQQAIVREMTVNITPHEFFTFEECYEARPGALLNLDTIVLPEDAVMKVDAGSNKYLRVIQRPGRLEIQIAKTIPAGDHNVYFHITYPGQPETTKVFLLRVGGKCVKETTTPETTTPSSPETTTPAAPTVTTDPTDPTPPETPNPTEPTEPTTPETPGSENPPALESAVFPSSVSISSSGTSVIRPVRGTLRDSTRPKITAPEGWTVTVKDGALNVTPVQGATQGIIGVEVGGKTQYITVTVTADDPANPGWNTSGATSGACVEPPAGYAVPLAWVIPLLGLAAVHFPMPGLPQPLASYQEGLGTNVSMGIGAVLSVIAIASAIGYGVSCYGTSTGQEP